MQNFQQNLECQQKDHQGNQLGLVCIDNNCKQKGLICIMCQYENHEKHKALPLKIFLNKYTQGIENYKQNMQGNNQKFNRNQNQKNQKSVDEKKIQAKINKNNEKNQVYEKPEKKQQNSNIDSSKFSNYLSNKYQTQLDDSQFLEQQNIEALRRYNAPKQKYELENSNTGLEKQKEQIQNKNYSNDKNLPENGNKKITKKEDYDLIGLFGSQAMDMLGLQSQELQKSQTNQFKTSEVDINNKVLGEEIDEKIQEINIKAVENLLQTQKKLQDQQKQLNQAGDDQEIFIDIRHSSPINADEKKMVRDLVFLDGNRIATCSVEKQIIIWQQNGQKIQQKKMHKKFIQQLAYSSNFGLLASVDIGGTLIVWKDNYHATLQNTNSQPVKKYDERNGGIEYIIGQNNCHKDNTYSVIFLDQLNNNNYNNNNQLQQNQEQQLIATSGNDNCVKIWKINKNSLDLLYVLKNQTDICFSVLNNTVRREIISGGDGNILIWKDPTQQLTNDSNTKSKKVVKEQQQIYEVKSFKAHSGYINQMILQISNQSPVIFTCSDDQTVKIWDAYSYNLLNVLEESMSIGSICYIDISQILVVGLWDENSESGGLCFWAQGDDDQYEQIQQVEKVKSGVTSVKINYENNLLISSHLNGKLEIFSLKYEVVNS